MLRAISISALVITLVGFSYKVQQLTTVKFKYPSTWPKPHYDFKNNPLSDQQIALGRRLFYDPKLSANGMISCSSCHLSFTAFTHVDHALSHGINDSIGTRNSPVLINLAWNKHFMWDGAVNNIQVQALAPISHAAEMGSSINEVVRKINADSSYFEAFHKIYGTSYISSSQILIALAQFQLTLVSANSKYDKVKSGIEQFTNQELQGYRLFQSNCSSCHSEPLFTNGSFQNNGLKPDSFLMDSGRFKVSRLTKDIFKFKVPTLRNIEFSFPYMHDGRFNSLNQVLNHYSDSNGTRCANSNHRIQLNFSSEQKVAIVSFLLTLSDKEFLFNPKFAYPRS